MSSLIVSFFNSLYDNAWIIGASMLILFKILYDFIIKVTPKLFDTGDKKIATEKTPNEDRKKEIKDLIKDEIISFSLNEGSSGEVIKAKDNLDKVIRSLIESNLDELEKESDIENKVHAAIEKKIAIAIKEKVNNNNVLNEIKRKAQENLRVSESREFQRHIEREYSSIRTTKALMTNIFTLINLIYFLSLSIILITSSFSSSSTADAIPTKLALVISFAYIGFGSFVIYMIKSCNSRSLTLIALREEIMKRHSVVKVSEEMLKNEMSEHHIALVKLLSSSTALKEQQAKHPYELFLNGIKDSNIMFKGGKFEIEKTQKKDDK